MSDLLPKHLALDSEHDPTGTRVSLWLQPTRYDRSSTVAPTLGAALAAGQQQADQLQSASFSSMAFMGGGLGQLGGLGGLFGQ